MTKCFKAKSEKKIEINRFEPGNNLIMDNVLNKWVNNDKKMSI